VGLTELESVTSCVSSRRSNQLSYKPLRGVRRPPKTGVHVESKKHGSALGVQMASKTDRRKPMKLQQTRP
jgi:hypothetical protein